MEQTINLSDLYNELQMIRRNMITKQELVRFAETIIIESNSETMSQIESSERDISSGRFKKINSVKDII